jgi:hypothetical protein
MLFFFTVTGNSEVLELRGKEKEPFHIATLT